jgi:acid phosphatase
MTQRLQSLLKLMCPLVAIGALTQCAYDNSGHSDASHALSSKVKNIVVIYAENRSFDNLYGHFPGADGLGNLYDADGRLSAAYKPQKDRDGQVLAHLPQVWGGVTAGGISPVVTQAQSAGLPNAPFSIESAFIETAGSRLTPSTVTRDLYHRFYENQMQINGGANDGFAAWADSGGLPMGHFDYSQSAMYSLARQYVLADHFFQGAFGGSFLNHQYLICACAPEYPNADTAAAVPSITALDIDEAGHYLPKLAVKPGSPASAMDGPPSFVQSGNITPANYFGDGKFYAVNTMQPLYQPSGNAPINPSGPQALYANPSKATTLPAQTATTIGDTLSAKGVSWAWYAGAWRAALNDGKQAATVKRSVIYTGNSFGVATPASVDFQAHHQPFNYYARFDPVQGAAQRNVHLLDYTDLLADAAAGQLPAVAFYKPEGLYNQHEGYANLSDGDARIAEVVARLQASPQWRNMVIVITYDEFGGAWDHVSPPKADLLGPGTRIPALVISPFAKKGTVDHTPYDTGSVLRLITHTFGLATLPGVAFRDAALKAHGMPAMGDMSAALQLD